MTVSTSLFTVLADNGNENGGTPEDAVTITILHTNDMHGRLFSSNNAIGLDTIAAIHASIPNSILVDAGDTIHGLPFVTFNQGANAIELMNAAGYRFFAPGNHDFNFGFAQLETLSQSATFEILAANLTRDGQAVFGDISVVEMDGVSVGFFGLAYPGTPTVTNPAGVVGLSFSDPVEAAQRSVAELQALDADVIIAIAHLGIDGGDEWARTVAQAVPAIDVIIDGHSHSRLDDGYLVGDVLVAQAGAHGAFLGVVEVVVYEGEVLSITASLIDREMSEDFTPVAEITAMIDTMQEALDEILSEVVGYSPITFYGDDPDHRMTLRSSEVPIGNLVADAMRWSMDADLALMNSGGIRYHLHAGDITKGDIITVLAFFNYAVVVEITPAQLWEALEIGVSAPGHGRFPQVSGFSFTFDQNAEDGERIQSITVDGVALDQNDTTTTFGLVINDFNAVGGDDYTVFVGLPVLAEGGTIDELLIEFIAEFDISETAIEGRIINVASDEVIETVAEEAVVEEEVISEEDATTEEETVEDTEYITAVTLPATIRPLDTVQRHNVDGVYFLSFRQVAEAYDATVEWVGETQTVVVTSATGDVWYFVVGYQDSFLDAELSMVFVTYAYASGVFY